MTQYSIKRFSFLTLKHLFICVETQIGDKIVEILYSNRLNNPHPSPVPWGVYCFL